MSEHSTTDGLLFPELFDRRLGLTTALVACLEDERQASKVRHELSEMLTQRVMAIACGHADANDAARLAADPVHKLLAGRDPVDGEDLASQPTLSRFENAPDRKQLFRVTEALAACVIERHRRRLHGRARRITIDLDPTDDPTHGAQQLSFFNGHYDTWCYLPVVGFLTFNDEAEQYLVTAILRPGDSHGSRGAVGILRRLIERLVRAFPRAVLRVRLDGGFATPEVLEFLDRQPGLEYAVNMASNAVLQRFANSAMRMARRRSKKSGKTEHVYGECRYAAGTWSHRRRVLYKAEVVRHADREPRDNPRFVITNLKQNPQWIYERVYCQRGEIENRVKELHNGLEIGRTSCSNFWANQFRVLMTAAAYVLMQELRLRLARTACARAQVGTLRDRLLKLGAHVVVSVRRILVHLPQSFPYFHSFHRLALSLGARTG